MRSVALALLIASANASKPSIPDRTLVLNDHALRLHFANAATADLRPLLVYATGDGGWHRKDLAAFKHLVALDYPIVGFDAHDYVTHLGSTEATTPQELGHDYDRIIAEARLALHLPDDYPVVLVGVSRGADLSVVAAGQRSTQSRIAGVVAVALTREEEYVKRFRLRRLRTRAVPPEMIQLYEYLPRLADTPVAVIQSTRDNYLPAAQARALFGMDTPYRWLQPIEARNHSFGGARPQLYSAIARALEWVRSVIAVRQPPEPSAAARAPLRRGPRRRSPR